MHQFKKWSWAVIALLSFADIVVVAANEGFVRGKVWPYFVTLILGLYFCYRNFIRN